MKLKFKIYQYRNELGEDVFRVKEKCIWFWVWHVNEDNPHDSFYDTPFQTRTREEMIAHLTKYANKERKKLEDMKHFEKASKLTLVIIEEVEV